MSTTTEQPGRLLPTLPGMVRGIVGLDDSGPRKVWSLQCERCFVVEKTDFLIAMSMRFHPRSQNGHNPRLCPECRITAYAGCNCDYCSEDRRGRN